MFENKTQYPIQKVPSKRMFEIPFIKKMNLVGFVLAQKIDPKSDALIGSFPEFGRSDRAEFLAGGRYGNSTANKWLDPPKDV